MILLFSPNPALTQVPTILGPVCLRFLADSGENNRAKHAKRFDSEQLPQQSDSPGIGKTTWAQNHPLRRWEENPADSAGWATRLPSEFTKITRKNAILYKQGLGFGPHPSIHSAGPLLSPAHRPPPPLPY
jgi:hypothetical protein